MLKNIRFNKVKGGVEIIARGYQSLGYLKNKISVLKGSEPFSSSTLTTAVPILKSQQNEFYESLETNFYNALKTDGYLHVNFKRFKEDLLIMNVPQVKICVLDPESKEQQKEWVEYQDSCFIHTYGKKTEYHTRFPNDPKYIWVLITGSKSLSAEMLSSAPKEVIESQYTPALIRPDDSSNLSPITTKESDVKYIPKVGSRVCAAYLFKPKKQDTNSIVSSLKLVGLKSHSTVLSNYDKQEVKSQEEFTSLYNCDDDADFQEYMS